MLEIMWNWKGSVKELRLYYLRIECNIMFKEGLTYTTAAGVLKMAQGTAKKYYEEFIDEYPEYA